ncbi:DTW domain-containing protein, partial [Salmonella enterica]|uniref:DTW domain-containing protein n=1 Tax=Salmonella enterica TaxID=28901 RepID=UPI00398C57FE
VTRRFLAGGNRGRPCKRGLLTLKSCLCDTLTPYQGNSRFCLGMLYTEPMKPSNTGRLIADMLPDTAAFQWSRTETPQALLELVQHPEYHAVGYVPASYDGERDEVGSHPPAGKPSAIMMGGGDCAEAGEGVGTYRGRGRTQDISV